MACCAGFYFQYVAQLEPEFSPSSLVFGGAVHAAIEEHFRSLMEGRTVPGLDDLLAVYDTGWESAAGPPVQFGKGENAASLRELARRMLQAFQASDLSKLDSDEAILGVEEEIRAFILPDCPELLGRIDLITQTAASLRITDFKTSRSAWGSAKIEEATHQQLLYGQLVGPLAEACGAVPISIAWVVITKAKTPAVTRHEIRFDPDRMRWTNRMVLAVWQAIAGEHFHPVPSTVNCASCSFRTACSKWEDYSCDHGEGSLVRTRSRSGSS